MWAQQLIAPGHFEQVYVPAPEGSEIGPGYAVVEVHGGGICGSDLPFFAGRIPHAFRSNPGEARFLPGMPLHEVMGTVVEADDAGLSKGDRVVGWATQSTALAERTVTLADNLYVVPDDRGVSDALTLQPLACVLETVRGLGDLNGTRVAVLGLGPFGLLFAHAVKSAGARSVTGIDRVDRSDAATAFLVDEFVHNSADWWSSAVTEQERPDLVIEAIGHNTETLGNAIEAVRPGGRVFFFGVPDEPIYPVPVQKIFRKGVTVSGGAIGDRRTSLRRADAYLRQWPGLHDAFVTDVFSANDAQKAFEVASVPSRGHLKVQFTMAG